MAPKAGRLVIIENCQTATTSSAVLRMRASSYAQRRAARDPGDPSTPTTILLIDAPVVERCGPCEGSLAQRRPGSPVVSPV